MNEDDARRPGTDVLGDDDASSLKDCVVDAEQGTSLPIVQDDDDDEEGEEEEEEEEEEISEASTLVPSRGSASLIAQSWQQQQEERDDEEEGGEEEEGGPRVKMRRLLGVIFSGEGMLKMGMLGAMAVMVVWAVVRAMEGVFSPGLVGGGGLMMILCIVVNKRDSRGGLVIG
ncbi:hypothetical protein V8C37DRAFT_131237 [Trichoderma ceciliae]